MSFFIISGLSGSGKTIALQAMEDAGFYCIDNLPAALMPAVAAELARGGLLARAAIAVDARNRQFLADAPKALKALKDQGIGHEVLFLEADESVLVTRFKESRRKHPMQDDIRSLPEAIHLERELLEPMSLAAGLRIDTTHTNPHALRARLLTVARGGESAETSLLLMSFGFKHGTPRDADYVFDVRCLPNPHWQQELRPLTGKDASVAKFLEQYPEVTAMKQNIRTFLETWLPAFRREERSWLTVAVGCTGGQHRSVYLVERLALHFREEGIPAQVRHREIA